MAVGFIALRAEAVTSGAVLGWDNTVILATNVGSPWLQNLFVAGLSGLLIFWCVRDSSGDEHNRVYPPLCAFGVLILGTVWFSGTKDYSFVPYTLGGPLEAHANPVGMWAEAGALSPAVHASIETSGWNIDMRHGRPWVRGPLIFDPTQTWRPAGQNRAATPAEKPHWEK